MAAAIDEQTKRWTYEEYCKLGEDRRCEVIDGELFMAPSPDSWHQDWLLDLTVLLRAYVRTRGLGRLFIAPLDVVLDAENTVQPDLVFVAAANAGIVQRRGIFGTPDLVVEMLSPWSARRDRHEKMDLYAKFGVAEYWIGDPADRSLEVFTLEKGRYGRRCGAEKTGRISSLVLTGLEFDLSELEA